MEKIKIVSQCSSHQYDALGNIVTNWDNKKCAWIVVKNFENKEIDWWGNENDFPAGYTLADYEKQYPNWDKLPDIKVTWAWNTKETCIKAFGSPHSFGKPSNYWDLQRYPYTHEQSWGYLDYTKEQAIDLRSYANFDVYADGVTIEYNGEIIYKKG